MTMMERPPWRDWRALVLLVLQLVPLAGCTLRAGQLALTRGLLSMR